MTQPKIFIIASRTGQLGNRICLFAHFIAYAIEHNILIVNPAFYNYAEFFQTTGQDVFCRYPEKASLIKGNQFIRHIFHATILALVKVRLFKVVDVNMESVPLLPKHEYSLETQDFENSIQTNNFVVFKGWSFRSNKNCIKHADLIRDYFKPAKENAVNVFKLIRKSRETCDILVGIHIRHGDYKEFLDGKHYYSIENYVNLMRQFSSLFLDKKVKFLICSNASFNSEDFLGIDTVLSTNHIIEDMYALAECDYIIGPPSTYTTWASFYGKVPLYKIFDLDIPLAINNFKVYLPGGYYTRGIEEFESLHDC